MGHLWRTVPSYVEENISSWLFLSLSADETRAIFTGISVDWNEGGVKHLLLFLHRCASFET